MGREGVDGWTGKAGSVFEDLEAGFMIKSELRN